MSAGAGANGSSGENATKHSQRAAAGRSRETLQEYVKPDTFFAMPGGGLHKL